MPVPDLGSGQDARFAACLAEVLVHEGGYVDHPADPGGATNLGITRATLAAFRGLAPADLPKAEVRALTREEAGRIYQARFWQACSCGSLAPGLDLAVFDAAVNSGPARSARWLQQTLAVRVDGIVGPVTLAAARARPAAELVLGHLRRRRAFLVRLKTWPTFGRGWTRRLDAVEAAALAAAERHDAARGPAGPRPTPVPAARPAAPPAPVPVRVPVPAKESPMFTTLIRTLIGGLISREVGALIDAVLPRQVADPAQREAIRAEVMAAIEARGPAIADDAASLAAADPAATDKWVTRARPSFLYGVYLMVFGAIPFGIAYGLFPEFCGRVVEGVTLFLSAIPELGWYLFGSAYLGYSGLRSWDKKNGAAR
jgi:lysozyme family protein